jgi:hypothetical protein
MGRLFHECVHLRGYAEYQELSTLSCIPFDYLRHLTKEVLSSFDCSLLENFKNMTRKVRMPRLELGTSSLSVTRSNHLSYTRTLLTIFLKYFIT